MLMIPRLRKFCTVYYQVVKRLFFYTGNLLIKSNTYLEMYITAGPKKMAKISDKNIRTEQKGVMGTRWE